jgi:serine/threonine protein kinase/Tol biopolymer transport system component
VNQQRWAQIEELFHRAAECEPTQRAALLDEACDGDSELRKEVEALLEFEASAHGHVQAAVHSEVAGFGFSLEAGEVVSHYRIIDGLGAGGMGLVYLAEDIRLGRRVALKFLPEESVKDPAALVRFEREARAASALEHPNICPIYEFGEHEGQPFLVMQLLEGKTLRELLEERRLNALNLDSQAKSGNSRALPVVQALDLAIQIADGLNAAHQKGIIHRDIKPTNIFVTTQGQAKILDFGLAKVTSSDMESAESTKHDGISNGAIRQARPSATPDPFLSRTGVAMGTAGYMSPEQARGEKLDTRTDLFSFGLVLYEMATGHRAFAGDTGPALHAAILEQEPTSARKLNPELPTKLEAVVNKALEKDREQRYQRVSDMHADLEAVKRDLVPKMRRWILAGGTVAALLITGLILWVTKNKLTSPQAPPDVKLTQLTANSPENQVTAAAISPNGKLLAYVDQQGMHLKTIGTDDVRLLPLPFTPTKVNWEIMTTAWFPDSERFLANAHPATQMGNEWSSTGTSVWLFSVLGAAPLHLRDNALSWSVSPDGNSIAFTNTGPAGEELWLMGPDGGQTRRLFEAAQEASMGGGFYFFPDGKRASYAINSGAGDTVVVSPLSSGSPVTIFPPSEVEKMGDGAWMPDGRFLYSDRCGGYLERPDAPCNFWIERRDLDTGKLIEAPKRLTNWVGTSLAGPSITADGKRVAFGRTSDRAVGYIADLESGGARLSNSRRITFEEKGEDAVSDWTPDSKTFIVGRNRAEYWRVYKQSVATNEAQPITPAVEGGGLEEALLSPDQKWIIVVVFPFGGTPDGRTTVKVMRVPITGGSPELIFSMRNGSLISCARPPSKLCVVSEESPDRKSMVIKAFDPVGGRGAELERFDLAPDSRGWIDSDHLHLCWISPDGTRLAIARSPQGPIEIHSLHGQPTQIIPTKGLDKLAILTWAADAKGLFVSRHLYDGGELVYVELGGRTHSLWRSHGGRCYGRPSPDGRHIAISDSEQSTNIWMMEDF